MSTLATLPLPQLPLQTTTNSYKNQLPISDDSMSTQDNADNGCTSKPMFYELNRLNTYRDWQVGFIDKRKLASAGLFFTKKDDIVQCAFCGIELGEWQSGDDPMVDHRKWASYCPFVRGLQCGNIPMSENQTDRSESEGHDTCGKYGIQIRQNSYGENDEPSIDVSKYNIQTKQATHRSYATMEARLRSFAEWPVAIKQKPNELAEAGFYYTGKSDQAICFYCGGGLKNWEESDVPWEQHVRWFPKCGYLNLQKTPEYIKKICNKKAVLTDPQPADSVPNNPSSSSTEISKEDNTSVSSEEVKTVDNEKTKEQSEDRSTLCKICYSKEVGVVFLPCGHMIACVDCAATQTKCSICRHKLEATVRAFLS